MAEPTTVRELFDIPEQIRKGDFVLKLAEGVANPRETSQNYVVTPGLAGAFNQALGLVGSALRDGRSQAAYLHGSFGSGKSHFMAMLSLLLAGNEDAWRLPELHELRGKHGFVGTKNLLELQFHMIGQTSIEGAIFGGYLAYLQAKHPKAPLPGLFADEGLFDNAERLRSTLGDAPFFAPMNEGSRADAGWGDLGGHWDRDRFAAAIKSPDLDVRAELFTALVRSHFQGWEQESRRFVDLDAGLATIARHAAKLGYDGIVLFLDELILWLSGRGSDSAWLHREVEQMIKLVEAANMHREIPLVSFIARQRNLAEMVGEDYAGVENLRLHDSLSTILALRAIIAYDAARSRPKAPGRVVLMVDGKAVGAPVAFTTDTPGPIVLPEFGHDLAPGRHTLALKMEDGSNMPFSVSVTYSSVRPDNSEKAQIGIQVTLTNPQVREGGVTEATVSIANRSSEAIPTPVAIVGIPGGLEVRHDQLKELVRSGQIAAYEVIGREVILYWRYLKGKDQFDVPLSLTAAVPGVYTGPASRAYLYYTDEFKNWAPALKVTITPRDSRQ